MENGVAYIGKCYCCKAVVKTNNRNARCPRCVPVAMNKYMKCFMPTDYIGNYKTGAKGGQLNLKPIKGIKSNHVCDDRCTSAIGSKCECSCGGANHGADHIIKVEE